MKGQISEQNRLQKRLVVGRMGTGQVKEWIGWVLVKDKDWVGWVLGTEYCTGFWIGFVLGYMGVYEYFGFDKVFMFLFFPLKVIIYQHFTGMFKEVEFFQPKKWRVDPS